MTATIADIAHIRPSVRAACDLNDFPTNLDRDPPLGRLSPAAQLDIVLEAVRDGVGATEFDVRMDALVARRRSW